LGYLISFEGIEGCGKSTQAKLLAKRLEKIGRSCVLTREPGGTQIGREIRKVLLHPAHHRMAPEVELALYFADRAQHLREVIWPAIREGHIVITDRFTDSSLAYQGYARGLPRRLIRSLDRLLTGEYRPRFTVLLDLAPEDGLLRARVRNRRARQAKTQGRFELERLEFHRRVRKGYLQLAGKEKRRYVVVPAQGNPAQVHEEVWRRLAPQIGKIGKIDKTRKTRA
jgi:dTMP kinase